MVSETEASYFKTWLITRPNSDGRCKSCVAEHRCPSGWERLSQGSHCYRLFREKKAWLEAEQHCNSQGGHLAAVTNQEIHNYVNGKNAPVWVGGTDEGTEGRWRWSDCSTWRFEQWKVEIFGLGFVAKQPDNGPQWPAPSMPEHCLQLRHKTRIGVNDDKWYDVMCSDREQFVCSKKLCPPPPPPTTGMNLLFCLMTNPSVTTTTTKTTTTTTDRNISNLADKNSTNVTSTSDQGNQLLPSVDP